MPWVNLLTAVSCPCFISSVLINLLVQEACCPLRRVTFLCISRLSSFTLLSQRKDDRKTGGHGCVWDSVMDTVLVPPARTTRSSLAPSGGRAAEAWARVPVVVLRRITPQTVVLGSAV